MTPSFEKARVVPEEAAEENILKERIGRTEPAFLRRQPLLPEKRNVNV